jgi:hypothetical protein
MKKSELRQIVKEEIRKVLKEVGEGTAKPYDYKLFADTKDDIYYRFTTDVDPKNTFLGQPRPGTEYEVELRRWDMEAVKRSSTAMDVAFHTAGGDYDEETNDNVQYRVMATVVAIVKEVLQKHPEVTTLSFTPAKANDMDQRRARFYKAYVEKQLPGSTTIQLEGGGFKLQLPKR